MNETQSIYEEVAALRNAAWSRQDNLRPGSKAWNHEQATAEAFAAVMTTLERRGARVMM